VSDDQNIQRWREADVQAANAAVVRITAERDRALRDLQEFINGENQRVAILSDEIAQLRGKLYTIGINAQFHRTEHLTLAQIADWIDAIVAVKQSTAKLQEVS
jgi:hypothetical protein